MCPSPSAPLLKRGSTLPVVGVLLLNMHGALQVKEEEARAVVPTFALPSTLALSRLSPIETSTTFQHGYMSSIESAVHAILATPGVNPAEYAPLIENALNKYFATVRTAKIPEWLRYVQTTPEGMKWEVSLAEALIEEQVLHMKHYAPGENVLNKAYSVFNEDGTRNPSMFLKLVCPDNVELDLLTEPEFQSNTFFLRKVLTVLAQKPGLAHVILVDMSCQPLSEFSRLAQLPGTKALLG